MRSAWLWVVLVSGCASLNTNVSIKEHPTPATWQGAAPAPSIAALSWKEYFADPQLTALISEALTNNPDLGIALQRIEQARAGVKRSTGALLPRLDLALGSGVRRYGLYTMDGAGNATTDITPGQVVPVNLGDFLAGFQASWEIDLWGKLRNQKEATVARYLASVEGSHLVITSLVADVATAWFDLRALDRLEVLLREAIDRQREAMEIVQLQKAAGRATELAVQQFEVQLAETKALAVITSQQRVEAQSRLNLLLGRPPRAIAPSGAIAFEVEAPVGAGVPADVLRARPDIRAAELELKAAGADLESARAAFFPNITLGASLGVQAFNPVFLARLPESLIYSVVGGLVAPLLNRSGLEAEFDGAKALKLEALHAYQRVALTAYAEVENGLSDVTTTSSLVALRQQQQRTVERSIETADTLFRAGKASSLEVLFAQQSRLRADVELVEAWRRQRIARVTIYKVLGGGWQ
ncbi:MAG: TolC family protein [Myxococcales bacterium]|nr:TolC family protein [Myxococcales bacterium]